MADSTSAVAEFPRPDTTYVNVVLMIDPAWPYLGRFQSAMTALGFGWPTAGGFVDFMFVELDELTEDVQVNYATTDVLGRAESYKTYTGATNRTIPMTFHFHCQGFDTEVNPLDPATEIGNALLGSSFVESLAGDANDKSPYNEVVLPTRRIEVLKQPFQDTSTGLSYAPPPLLLAIGNLLLARVILTDVSVTWNAPFEPGTMYPHGSTVRCTFTVVRNEAVNSTTSSSPLVANSDADRISRFIDFPYLNINSSSGQSAATS